jgi:translation initiation factor 1
MSRTRKVWSSEGVPTCPRCRRLETACRCKSTAPRAPADGIVRVARSTRGRKGKGVTIVTGLPLQGEALAGFAKRLKAACGAGGTVKDDTIEIQGEHRDRLAALLEAEGWTVKRAGG